QDPLGKGSYLNRVFQVTPGQPELILFDPKQGTLVRWNEITKQSSLVLTAGGKPINSEPTGWLRAGNYAWLSTDENFYRYDILSNKATIVNLPPPIFPSNERTIRNVVADKEGNLWIRLRTQGIIRYDPAGDKASYAKFINPELDRSYSAIFYDTWQHCLWVAVEHGGLYKYNVRSGETKAYPLYQQEGTNPATITGIAGTADGNLYMSDATAGLYFYDKTSDSFSQITKQDGLPGNNCNSLAIDKKGFVWIATSQGLSRYDPATRSFLNFADDDVLPSYLSFITTADNEQFYICAGFSFYKWNSAAIPASATGPLYIRHITVNNKAVPVANSYTLSYYQNNITIQIGAIVPGMGRPPVIEYTFNKGSDWIKMEPSHMVNFSRLPPGRYTIQVRQKGNNEQLTIHFTINFPWWKRGWFIAAVLLLLLSAGTWLIRRRIKAIRKEALLKQKMAETEMMALRAQMNPHFIFNCISSIDNFIQDNDKENASAWLNKFAKLIRSILDSSKNEVVPFWKDWETLKLYLELEQLRSDNKFTIMMNADDELLNGHYRIPPLIIQPYVENAIHHGLLHRLDKNGLLKISAVLNNNQLIYTIEDNGIGRQKAAELNAVNRLNHNSYGMQMSRERIELFNRQHEDIKITDLTDPFGDPSGTKAEIILYV
ncbi:MAG: histidine kinase, partial [Chitinophagaceae bacterium]|nr:histidine kinase [Chitinophagaceae bacterium]